MAFISNGTTILDNGAFSVGLGNKILISEQTASASASIEFTTGIDSTYPIYRFEFIDIHPANNDVDFAFNLSTDGGSNYNVTKTSTAFNAFHYENDVEAVFAYNTPRDLAQSTSTDELTNGLSNANDGSASGEMFLFNPSSTTFVKHYLSRFSGMLSAPGAHDFYKAGYGNTTSAINAVQFLFQSGNTDSGTIKLYGIKDS